MTFTLVRSGVTTGTSTVKVETADGTAHAPGDYAAVPSSTVTFGPGVTTMPVNVTVAPDYIGEANESLTLKLKMPTNAVIADTAAAGTITDDDGDGPQLGIDDVSVTEGDTATFTITRYGDITEAVSLTIKTGDKTAVSGSDYAPIPPVVITIPAGVASATVGVAIESDGVGESTETFKLSLSKPVDAIIADATGIGTIVDDDGGPILI
jgi:hypothetical protein